MIWLTTRNLMTNIHSRLQFCTKLTVFESIVENILYYTTFI